MHTSQNIQVPKKRHAEFYRTAIAFLNEFWYDKPQHSRESQICHNI